MRNYTCTEAIVAKLLPSLPSFPMVVHVCKYKMWVFTIKRTCMLHSPIQCPKVKLLDYQDTCLVQSLAAYTCYIAFTMRML